MFNGESIDTRFSVDLHKTTKSYNILKIPSFLAYKGQGVFRQDVRNELESLQQRHMTPNINTGVTSILQGLTKQFTSAVQQNYSYKPATMTEVLKDKVGMLRARYVNAFKNLKIGKQIDSKVKAFIKIEKFSTDKLETKAPRMIQHRSYEYLACLNKYLKPLDEHIKTSQTIFRGQTLSSIIGRGKDSKALMSQILELSKDFKQPRYICLDHTAWDAHVTKDLLKLEHSIYNDVTKNRHLKHLLKKQLKNIGVTQNGVRYKTKGRRMSGEYNTSLGNTILNYLIIKSVVEECGILKSAIVCNGDDSILIIEDSDYHKFDLSFFTKYNQVTKMDKSTIVLEELEFCQSSPVWFPDGYRLIRNPERVISRATCMITDYSKAINRYLMSIGLCELAQNRGVPILQNFSLRLIELAEGKRPIDSFKDYKSTFEPSLQVQDIHPETRESFYRAFGIDTLMQGLMERVLGPMTKLKNFVTLINKYKNYHQGRQLDLKCLKDKHQKENNNVRNQRL